jgi:hypothetical protein
MTGLLGGLIGSFTEIPTAGLQLYLDASNPASYSGSGSTWTDLSGKNKNFSWNSPSYNSSGIKYFNTYGRTCSGPASNSFNISNNSGYTFFMTMYQNSLQSSAAFKWHSSNGTGSASRGIFSHCTWVDGSVYWDQGGCCDPNTRTVSSSVLPNSTGSWHVMAFRNNYASTNRQIFRNNSVIGTNTAGIADINLNGTAAQVGGSDDYPVPGASGSVWDARIGQFAVYNRPLSDSEMTQVYERFRVKVGI